MLFLEPQTASVPDGGPTVASRGTLTGGNAVIDAAQKIKNTIFKVIKDDLKASDISETEWSNGMISLKEPLPGIYPISFEKAVRDHSGRESIFLLMAGSKLLM